MGWRSLRSISQSAHGQVRVDGPRLQAKAEGSPACEDVPEPAPPRELHNHLSGSTPGVLSCRHLWVSDRRNLIKNKGEPLLLSGRVDSGLGHTGEQSKKTTELLKKQAPCSCPHRRRPWRPVF